MLWRLLLQQYHQAEATAEQELLAVPVLASRVGGFPTFQQKRVAGVVHGEETLLIKREPNSLTIRA